jgi:5'-methylthioadenosine phosphorylase
MGFSVIGMTQAIEAKLAKELEFCFLPLAFVTDYDCWHSSHAAVTVDMIIDNLNKNTTNAVLLLKSIIKQIDKTSNNCNCQESLRYAIITQPGMIPPKTYNRLKIIVEKYIER